MHIAQEFGLERYWIYVFNPYLFLVDARKTNVSTAKFSF